MRPVCAVQGCGRERYARGWCEAHYKRDRDGRPMTAPLRNTRSRRDGFCSASGCSRARYRGTLCSGHWHRKRDGRPDWERPILLIRGRNDAEPRTWVGKLPKPLMDRIASVARSRRMSRLLLIESVLAHQFPPKEAE